MLALIGAASSTGTGIYYYLFFILLLIVVFSFASALWTLVSAKVSMKGVKSRVTRGDKLMTILTLSHKSLLPAGELRVSLNVPGASHQEISFSAAL